MKLLKYFNWLFIFSLVTTTLLQESFATTNFKNNKSLYDNTTTLLSLNTSTPGLIQVEDYTSVTGEVQVEPSSDSDGTTTVGYFDEGDILHFNTSVSSAFAAKIRVRVASFPGGNLIFTTNNGTLATVQIPPTGGWTEWSTQEIVLDFPVSNELNLTTSTGGVNVNWIEIIENDCPNPVLTDLSVTAETLTILPEQSLQLFANGTDGCGNTMSVNPTWSSNAPNGFFVAGSAVGTAIVSVSQNGITTSVTINIERPSKKYNFVVNDIGRLQVSGNQIVGDDGQNVSLAGNSLFWSSAAPSWYSKETVNWLAEDWETQVIRAAMSVNPLDGAGQPWNQSDYVQAPDYQMGLMTEVINAAIENDIYVMVDFHEHYSNNYTAEAVQFFGDIARQYNGYDNIIYELWNEPINDSWSTVKAHAEVVIAEIRKYDPDNLIVVGTPFYSQRVDDAGNNPINDNNVAYALHGYATEPAHGALRRRYNAPTVGTEWGISVNDNGGGETGAWVDYWRNQDGGRIHVMWAVNNKQVDGDENWSILNSNVTATSGWSDSDLSASGRFQKNVIKGWTDHVRTPICLDNSLASIQLNVSETTVPMGSQVNLTASGVSVCGENVALNGEWSSNAPNGIFTAVNEGISTISYTAEGITEEIQITVLPNQAPIVNAGQDIILVQPNSEVTLQGQVSDPENDNIVSTWNQISGPSTSVITSPNNAETLVQNLTELGTYVFELTASDQENSTSDIVNINVVANTPPTASAGVDQVVGLGVAVLLNGTGTDNEGDALSYSWSQIQGPSAAIINDVNSQNIAITGLEIGSYIFEVAVHDGTSTVTDQVNIEVIPEVELLTNGDFSLGAEGWTSFVYESATANNNIVNGQLESVQSYAGWESWHVQFYQGNLTIENGQTYTLKFRARSDNFRNIVVGVEKNGAPYTGYLSETVALSTTMQSFEYEFTMTEATENNGRVAFNLGNDYGNVFIDDVSLVSTNNEVTNSLPTSFAGENQILVAGTTSTSLNGSGTDTDGPSNLSFNWIQTNGPSVTLSNETSENPTITGLTDGSEYSFELTTFDGLDYSSPSSVTISVESNQPEFVLRIEAEDYSGMSGIQTENSSEGGLNVGYIDANDWLAYDNIDIPQSGTYRISYRVASASGGGRLKFEKAGGSINYGEIDIPSTGGWQNWITVSHDVNLEGGNQNLAIAAINGGFNINWLEITLLESSNTRRRVASIGLEEELTLYPNPATNIISIKGLSTTVQKVDLYNIQGSLILSKNIQQETKLTMNISELKTGVYLMYIADDKGVSVKRFIKK